MFWTKYKLHFIIPFILVVTFSAGYCVGILTAKADTPLMVDATDSEPITSVTTEVNKICLGEFMLTGYCICAKCCGGYSDGYTATMTKATPGRTIAVDPEVIPYGTIVEINGDEYIAEDCGGAIKGNHIDILCASHELAEEYGVQYAEVYAVINTK